MNWKPVQRGRQHAVDTRKNYICAYYRRNGKLSGVAFCTFDGYDWHDMTSLTRYHYTDIDWYCEIEYPWENSNCDR